MTSSEDFGGSYPAAGDSPLSGGYPAGGYVPPVPPTSDYYRPPVVDEQPSTADVAKDQASSVAGGAAEAAQHVAGVAKEQVGQVTAEASRQVKHLVGQAKDELSTQAQSQQERAATGLHSVGDQLKAMASGSGQPGVAADLAKQAAEKVHEIAGWLEKDPAILLNDVRSFARQRPGMFLAVALGAGIVAGRLARGMTTDPDKVGQDDNAQLTAPATSGYVTPPVTGGYLTTPPPLEAGYGSAQGSQWASAPAGGLGDYR